MESRWLRWIGPGLVALGAVGFIAATAAGAGAQPWVPRACVGPALDRITAARDQSAATPADLVGTPWFRLDPVLEGDGSLRGQRLTLGLDGARTVRSLGQAAESFAAGPFGRVILAGSDDGATSRLQAIDVANGCAWAVGDERSVIRRATIDPSGTYVYEVRVRRDDRADDGIWQSPLDGRSAARRVLAPLPVDERFGRTFSTEFGWDSAGDRLAVQSCGESACRTRIIRPDGGQTVTLDAPGLGPLVGLDGDRVVTYGACRGLPCPIVSTDVRTGARRVLAPDSGLAVVVQTSNGSRLVHEVGAGATGGLRVVSLDGGSSADLGPLPAGLRLHPVAARAEAATRLPPDWVLLAPDGRIPGDGALDRLRLRHVPDGSTVPFEEALR